MQDSKYLEQLRQELVELSPDFAHDEKNIKNLISHMLSHKIKVQQNTHFKDQLADRLSRHIAWKSNPENTGPAPTLATSWLARLVMYGLPSLALCAAVLYTVPRSPSQILTPMSFQGSGQSQELTTSDMPSRTVNTTIVSQKSQSLDQNTKPSLSHRDTLLGAGNKELALNSITDDTTTEPQQVSLSNTSSSSADILMKTTSPILTNSLSNQRPIEPSATLQEWKSFAQTIEKLLPVTIEIHEDGLLDCIVREGILCTVLPDWALKKEHKLQLFDEIIKNISPDTMNDEKKNELKKTLGLE